MPSSWPIYSFVIFAALLGILIPAGVRFLGTQLSRSPAAKPSSEPTSTPTIGSRVNLRFFLGVGISVLLLCSIFLLLPVVAGFAHDQDYGNGIAVIFALLIFVIVGLFYSVRKTDLSWQKTLPEEEEGRP